jgi:hypothetical protein
MDTFRILADLRSERERIDRAISALESLDGTPAQTATARRGRPAANADQPTAKSGGRRRISAAGRARIAAAAKAMWARRKAAAGKNPAGLKKAAPARRGMSAAARKRISEMMKKRWAQRKKAAAKA